VPTTITTKPEIGFSGIEGEIVGEGDFEVKGVLVEEGGGEGDCMTASVGGELGEGSDFSDKVKL
jgi:hypothetical protein